jgi:hypothetical protein
MEQTKMKSELPGSASRTHRSNEGENDELHNKFDKDQYLRTNVIDVFGQETEPLCDYLRCHHKFSEHGLVRRKCKCKHPSNSATGTYFLLLHD